MHKLIATILFTTMPVMAIPTTGTYIAEEPDPLSVQELVSHYADKFGVSQELAHYIAFNESGYNPEAVGDMDIICNDKRSPFYGQPVRARGVMQLTQCWYYHVSDEEAFDPETNIRVAMEVISRGEKTCRSQFSTCDKYYKNL